ncbi:MAG: hypothetical protein HY291_20050 [Planctomycetes bacterium]|nr:hypothetical protein [Planctomycetota bacterium]
MFMVRRFKVLVAALAIVLLIPSPCAQAFKAPALPLYAVLENGDLIVLATAEVPEAKEELRGKPEKAVLKIAKVFKGDAKLKQIELTFQRGMGTLGLLEPVNGQPSVYVLKKDKDSDYAMPGFNGLRKPDEAEQKRIERVLEVQQRVSEGKPPAEDEIRKLAADADGDIAVFGVHLMSNLEPARFADFAATALEKKSWCQGEITCLFVSMPAEKSVPLVLNVLTKESGDYTAEPSLGLPFDILRHMLQKAPPPAEFRPRIAAALMERYKRDGDEIREKLENGLGDPLIELLAQVADKDCIPVLQKALVFGLSPGRQGSVDPAAVAALWKLQGAEALPLLRAHLLESTGPVQSILGEHGDASDFPRLLACAEKEPSRCGTDAIGGMKRLVERAGLALEPWMDVQELGAGSIKNLEKWNAWYEKHGKELKIK